MDIIDKIDKINIIKNDFYYIIKYYIIINLYYNKMTINKMSVNKAIALKFTAPNGETYFCLHPMIQTLDKKNNTFIFQLLRSVDLGMLAYKGEKIKVEVLLYPNNLKYNDIFTINDNNNLIYNNIIIKSLGIYTIPVDIVEEEITFNMKKGYIKKVLKENPNLNISLRTIYHNETNGYEITLPMIEGDLSYLE
jgi:hypothetical protein